jgi:hypothetical protein
MVSLIVGALVVGGVMGAVSTSLHYSRRLEQKMRDCDILSALAERLLSRPEALHNGVVALEELPGVPAADVAVRRVEVEPGEPGGKTHGELYRVRLRYATQELEFSMIVPPRKDEP